MGEAGVGKDTLLNVLLKNNEVLHSIVSSTTRPMREGEINGVTYHFLSNEEFSNQVLNGDILEAVIFNNWCYGTTLSSLRLDKINIGIFSPFGIISLCENKEINVFPYYIKASPKTRLLRQLNRENDPNVEEIIRRYSTDLKDFSDFDFDYCELKNENLEDLKYAQNTIEQNIAKIIDAGQF